MPTLRPPEKKCMGPTFRTQKVRRGLTAHLVAPLLPRRRVTHQYSKLPPKCIHRRDTAVPMGRRGGGVFLKGKRGGGVSRQGGGRNYSPSFPSPPRKTTTMGGRATGGSFKSRFFFWWLDVGRQKDSGGSGFARRSNNGFARPFLSAEEWARTVSAT